MDANKSFSLYQVESNRELNSRDEGRVLPINPVTTPVAAIYVIFALEIAATRMYGRLILSSLIARTIPRDFKCHYAYDAYT